MAYKYSVGGRKFGDIIAESDTDADTKIDFQEDYISFQANGADVLVVSGSNVGIGTAAPDPDELLTIDGVSGNHEANIQFREDGANRSKIGINNSDNLVLHNQTINKHIVFKVNDQGVTREGLRIDGAVPEVVVNEGSESLVDFRVESDNNTHMLFVDGANDKIGINTDQPDYTLDVAGDIGVNQYIYHNGDGNTWINFTDNRIRLNAGGNNFIDCEDPGSAPHKVRINNGGNNIDFVIKDNSNNVYFTADASTSRVGIGTDAPDTTLHIHSDSINNGAVMISQADNSSDASQLDLSKARGSGASPAVVQNNDFIGQLRFLAYDGNSYDNFADIYAQAAGTISTTSHPTKIVVRTTKGSATSPTTAITIDENQNVIAEGNLEAKDQITIREQNAPPAASSNGFQGEIRYDSNYIYVCVADNTWKRVALSSW